MTTPGSNRYYVTAYRSTGNLGDAIQTAALSRLLEGELVGVYRDALPTLKLRDAERQVVSGWLGDMPPVTAHRQSLFAGVHLGRRVDAHLRWLASSRLPVGARDPLTHRLLLSHSIVSELVGCATLTLERYDGPRSGRYAVDEVEPGTLFLTNNIPADLPWPEQWAAALERLAQLRTAKVVFTRRLHVALPCLAFGTPVVVRRARVERGFQPARFSLLDWLGFKYDRPCTVDVAPVAARYRQAIERLLGREVRPGPYRYPVPTSEGATPKSY